jgi:hypothetical protein
MANIYCNFDLASGGDGSSGDPYGAAEFLSLYPTQTIFNMWYARGSLNAPTTDLALSVSGGAYHSLVAWNAALYGPYRIKVRDISGTNTSIWFEYGIVECRNFSLNNSFLHLDVTAFVHALGNFTILTSGMELQIYKSTFIVDGTWTNADDTFLFSSNSKLIGSPSGGNWVDEGEDSSYISYGVTSSISSLWPSIYDHSQFNWTPPVWPAWNAVRSSFYYTALSTGINTPPQPGTDTGNSGLWGEARLGIGACSFASPSYTLSYDANGGINPPAGSSYSVGATVTVASDSGMTRSGYGFHHWNTAADGSGTSYNPSDTFLMPAADVTLYAIWGVYVNFDLPSGGDGSTGDPYGAAGFWSNFPTTAATAIWYARGSLNAPTTSLVLQLSQTYTLTVWDADVYGPYRMNIQDIFYGNGAGYPSITFTGGIIACRDLQNGNYGGAGGLTIVDCFFHAARNYTYLSVNVWSILIFRSSTFVVDGIWELPSATYPIYFRPYNSTIDGTPTGGAWHASSAGANCAFTSADTAWPAAAITDSQYNWTPPTWPAWNAVQAAFLDDLLSVGITTPPQPGTDAGLTGLWGELRTGIGGYWFYQSARIIFSTGTAQAIVNTPQYGYESEIHMGLRYAEHRGAKWGIFDRGASYDYRILKTATLRLTATEQNDLNIFFLSSSAARGETVNLILGKKHTGFFPFLPDNGDIGTFTCRVLSYEQSGMLLSPYQQFETDISLVMVTAPGYTIPAQAKTAAGGLKIGTVSHIRYPQRGISPEPQHAISTIIANNGTPYSVDNGTSGDAYITALDLDLNETTAAALINYLVTSGRGNEIKIIAKDNNYLYGREKGAAGTYWSQLIDNIITVRHDRYNGFSTSLKFNLIKSL